MNSHCLTATGLTNTGAILPDYSRLYTSMPVLEDGLSSGHASDTENNNPTPYSINNVSSTAANSATTTSAQINNIFENKFIGNNMNSMGKMLSPTPITTMANNVNSINNANASNNISLTDALNPTVAVESSLKIESDISKTIRKITSDIILFVSHKIALQNGH